MSAPVVTSSGAAPAAPQPAPRPHRLARKNSILAHGEPSVWLTGGALIVAIVMIIALLLLILIQGGSTFWPAELIQVKTVDGKIYLGEVTREEAYRPEPHAFQALPAAAREKAKASVDQADGASHRRLFRTGNYELNGTHHEWISDFQVAQESLPEWAVVVERAKGGNFYGMPAAFLIDGKEVANPPADVWAKFQEYHDAVRDRLAQRVSLERDELGGVSRKLKQARIAIRQAELSDGIDSPQYVAAVENLKEVERWASGENKRIKSDIADLDRENARYRVRFVTADGKGTILELDKIVRAYPANQLGFWDKIGVYFSRWGEFLSDRPRESNTEGGVFPAIWGTVAMTLMLSLAVVPFGVLAALYLREYAKSGPVISAVRIAINNLAGVPSIVFGVFGLGFFCLMVGGYIDGGPRKIGVTPWPPWQWYLTFAAVVVVGLIAFVAGIAGQGGRKNTWVGTVLSRGAMLLWLASVVAIFLLLVKNPFFDGFFRAQLAEGPVFGAEGLLWASLTLALLTLPVVIVATEEALAAVPNSMREGSYACGASKWQTIRRIVLPRALPGIMTGMILAMARGAGEVAPLMLTGAKEKAPELPMDAIYPFIHLYRSFMHLGLHIFNVGFQSPNSEAARPMVYTTTLLLITIVVMLNVFAIWLRTRLRRRFQGSQF